MTDIRSTADRPLPEPYRRWAYIPDAFVDTPLSSEERVVFQHLLTWLAQSRQKASEHIGEAAGPMLALNANGSAAPIFWCFNSWVEPILLARKFGPDQPIYAMCSFYGAGLKRRDKVRYLEPLAAEYAAAIRALNVGAPLTIGGNCQAGPIAEATAHALMRAGEPAPLLIAMEYIPQRAYQGPAYMLFGAESTGFNPFLTDLDPVYQWRGRFARFASGALSGAHGRYFLEPAIDALVDGVKAAIAWAAEDTLELNRSRRLIAAS